MEAYARTARCRWGALHEYFGEPPPAEHCGVCDNCRKGLAALAG
jgi:superfamily II DNA helicase RecQ